MPENVINVNQELMIKFDEQVIELEEHKGESKALALKTKISRLHDLPYLLLKALEFRGDDRMFEIFLALIGYNKTNFEFREPISPEVALELTDRQLTDMQFYFIIYSEVEFTVHDVKNVVRCSKHLKSGDLEWICRFIQNTDSRISISKFLHQFSENRKLLKRKGKNDNQLLEALAMKLPTDCFKAIIKDELSSMNYKRLNQVSNMWVKGKIDDVRFFMILNDCVKKRDYENIIHEANKVRRLA